MWGPNLGSGACLRVVRDCPAYCLVLSGQCPDCPVSDWTFWTLQSMVLSDLCPIMSGHVRSLSGHCPIWCPILSDKACPMVSGMSGTVRCSVRNVRSGPSLGRTKLQGRGLAHGERSRTRIALPAAALMRYHKMQPRRRRRVTNDLGMRVEATFILFRV